ncbi:baseplate J/gp47 family protein [Paenibacillus larvae]|uniref:Baseplate protein n=2 Tax=root TaxID=1 RepID=A0A0C5AEG2_9CAUD|nr:baseplate J/gp47 family protein [Paenibacillus larvae]YP_009202229.1 baseplate J/gp47 family protein [Bacteriophage Lily]AJK27747.1 baseplate protein [Bacteriophage Lily]AVF27783.1 baseplate assembly protein [Paenibacillus larvae subsp. larvae]AVF32286.1 baseplate assembly protein [Paenibacillus larvae subsp. larvae]MBH0342707.1 baseplate J protein [Paenibacillus larvae]MCY7521034.1 baseplate J/gp47 family protein [Paenibacillus larvae]
MTFEDLPDVSFVSEDPNETINNIISTYEALSNRKLFPGDPERLFLMALAQIIIQQRVLINQTRKSNLIKFARGNVLDHMGAFMETERLPASPAITTVEFRLSMPLTSATIIPAKTRVAPQGGNGKIFFSTKEVLEIKAGKVSGTVVAECSISGDVGNGFLPGQLKVLVDPVAFVQSVTNTTESAGGAEKETDDSYRERIRSAPESFSVAGPSGAYEHWAKTAGSSVIDVGVDSPAPGEVVIVPLLAGGKMPTQDVLDEVAETVNDRRVRPMTDLVTVREPDAISYDISLTYWISNSRATEATKIQDSINRAIEEYKLWQKSKLGRDINPSELICRIMDAGASRVEIVSPVFKEVSKLQVALDAKTTITYGGLSE